MKALATGVILLLVVGCSAVTPKQQAFELGTAYKAAATVALAAVQRPEISDEAKSKIKQADMIAHTAADAAVAAAQACEDPCELSVAELGVDWAAGTIRRLLALGNFWKGD